MNKANHVLKAALAAAGLVGAVTMYALPIVAVAEDPKPPKLNAKVQKALAGAQEAIQAKDWAKAKEGIDAARAVEGKGPYDEFMIAELSGFVQLNQKDYAAAAASFEETVKSGYVPAADLPQRNKVLAQLYFQTENYREGDRVRKRVSRGCPVGPDDRRPGRARVFPPEGLCQRAHHREEAGGRFCEAQRADPASAAGEQPGAR